MMIKIIGAILVVCASWGIGLHMSQILEVRLKELIELKRGLELIRGEIRYQLTPLPETFTVTSTKMKKPFSNVFFNIGETLEARGGQSFACIWKEKWEEASVLLHLEKEDMELLYTLGTSLGYLDKEMQVNAIDFFLAQVDERMEEAKNNIHSKKKVYQTLGLMGGFLVVIVLI